MKEIADIMTFRDGSKMWEAVFDKFAAKVYIPVTKQPAGIVNFGFRAPYLMIFEENRFSFEEAKAFADQNGLAEIASEYAGSVVFFYPLNEGGWEKAPVDLYESILAQSRISQYYKDGAAIMYDRFAKKMGDTYIRGAVLRTCLYGFGASADYIAKNCLKTLEGDGLYGKGDITPAVCILQGLSVGTGAERRDIPILSIGNHAEVNQALLQSSDYVLVKDKADYQEDYRQFVGTFRRMMGYLDREDNLEEMGMVMEPGYCSVTTTCDNRGDDRDTTEHRIGYVAYYNRDIMKDGKKVPLLMCFHGGGDSAMCMATVSGWYRVAAEHDFLLVCVENHLNSTASETIEMIECLKKKYSIDSEKIYASGFSMGGCKSWDMFQEYPRVFAAVAPMDATFDVGLNSYGEQSPGEINRDTIVPVFYVGGEKTPLPELPFQEKKCLNRMAYVLEVNRSVKKNQNQFEEQDKWENPIWGLDGDYVYQLKDEEREDSVLTLNLFVSEDGNCYCVFGCVSNQGHEVRHHSCENAWKFLNSFRRLPDGSLMGGKLEEIRELYQ